jgi:dipeptidyl aminopeptidase/acylaminoacyl peptidase
VYFVHGAVPDQMDIWRMRPSGGSPERITFHNSRVTHPTFLDRRTLLYLATAADGSGPWLFTLDTTRRKPHRLSSGVERYTSLAASADGRRLVLTVANPTGTIWRVPVAAGVVNESAARRIIVPTTGGRSPRYAADSLLYVSARGDSEGIWKLTNDTATEFWSSVGARIIGGPAIAPDGRIALSAEQGGQARLYVMNGDGSAARELAAPLAPHGAPAWAPDGRSIVVASDVEGEPRVVRVSMDDESVAGLVSDYSLEPVWSPGGETLVYSGPDIGTTFQVSARAVDGTHPPVSLTLSRGARRLGFLPGRRTLVVLRGEINHKNFWLIDLDSGAERQLTNFSRQFVIRDFDVSGDGREIVFDQLAENSDIVMIDR